MPCQLTACIIGCVESDSTGRTMDRLSITAITAIVIHLIAVAVFPTYRDLCLDIAFWGWNLIF